MPLRAAIIALSILAAACAAQEAACGLVPVPKAVTVQPGAVALPAIRVETGGEQTPQLEYAVEVLGKLASAAAEGDEAATVTLRLAASAADLAQTAQALSLPQAPEDRWEQAFVLDCGHTDPSRITLTGGPLGIIYGAYALDQLVDRKAVPASAPRLAISDWPSLLTRAYTGIARDVSPNSLARLDWFARWRINVCYYEIYGDQGQDGAPPELAEVVRECHRRGITVFGQISNWRTELLLKRELCASNPEDLARIRRYSEELLDRGCDGLIFLFDDITQAATEHVAHCDKCRERFSGLAAAQLELMRPMLEVGRARGVGKFIVCPTPYWDFWKNCYGGKVLGEEYYPVWRDAELMDGVQVYHCTVSKPAVEEVQSAGLRNYIYWYNGAYEYEQCTPGEKRVAGLWGGFNEMIHGWYLYNWDDEKGIVPRPDALESLRGLPQLTQHAWLCGGGDYAWALWGAYAWDADRFEPAQTEALLVDALYGRGAAAGYARWKQAVRRNLPHLLGAPRAVPVEQRDAVVAEFFADAQAAEEAAQAFAATEAPGILSRDSVAQKMLNSARKLAERAKLAETDACRVTIGPVRESKQGDATYRDQDLELSSFWLRFSLRFSQTQEPDGTLHRSQWHFGSGLGMKGPSYRNWYDAGFIDVLLNGKSLDAFAPTLETVPGRSGEDLLATWSTDQGKVALRFSLFEGGLRIDGSVQGAQDAEPAVQLIAIPGAGWGSWEDMDKAVVTGSGEFTHGTPVKLAAGEDWLFMMDRGYDVPREKAEGPCAALFGAPLPAVECDNATYVVNTRATYPKGTERFRLVIWDFHGRKNAEALEAFRKGIDGMRERLKE